MRSLFEWKNRLTHNDGFGLRTHTQYFVHKTHLFIEKLNTNPNIYGTQ